MLPCNDYDLELFNDDCLDLMNQLESNSVDLVITDPPYEFVSHEGGGCFGSNKKQYHRELEAKKITNGFNPAILEELCRIMKKINIYIFCSHEQILPLLKFFVDGKKCNYNLITWHKTNPVPTCGNKYLSDTEYCLFFREKGVKVYGEYATKKTYYVTPLNTADKKKYGHPTCKPVDIIKNFIINSSKEGDIVFDPFMGSGSTGEAALSLKRMFTGCEINEEFYHTADKRLHESLEN